MSVLYARNPNRIVKTYAESQVAPHATAKRWKYEVPTGKIAMLEYVDLKVERDTVADSCALSNAVVNFRRANEQKYDGLFRAYLSRFSNTVGDKDRINVGLQMLMCGGDYLEARTFDLSTGGKVDYQMYAKITEYDMFEMVEMPIIDVQQPKAKGFIENLIDELKKLVS